MTGKGSDQMPQLHAALFRRPCVVQRLAPKPCAANALKSHTLTVLPLKVKLHKGRTAELPRGKKDALYVHPNVTRAENAHCCSAPQHVATHRGTRKADQSLQYGAIDACRKQ
eukprot:1433926-Heterocapsa_arctica.AAC.1